MKTYRIAFTYASPFNPQYGGVERVTDLLCRELVSRGHRVFYLHHRNPELYGSFLPPAEVSFCPNADYNAEENVFFYHRFLRENGVDFVINQAGNFGDSRLYLNVEKSASGFPKTISVLHANPGLNYEHLNKELLRLRNNALSEKSKLLARWLLFPYLKSLYLERRIQHFQELCRKTDCIALLSPSHIAELARLGVDLETSPLIRPIPDPCSYRVEARSAEKKKRPLFVGRLDAGQKAPERLAPIWRRLCRRFPDWELVVVGDGRDRAALERKLRRLPRVIFVGRQDPAKYYESAPIFCMTSNYEGFGMVLTEAMAFGCVPLAFDSFPSLRDIVDEGRDGFIIPPFDIDTYAEQCAFLMENENIRSVMAAAAGKKSGKFQIEGIVDRWEALFSELASPSLGQNQS